MRVGERRHLLGRRAAESGINLCQRLVQAKLRLLVHLLLVEIVVFAEIVLVEVVLLVDLRELILLGVGNVEAVDRRGQTPARSFAVRGVRSLPINS